MYKRKADVPNSDQASKKSQSIVGVEAWKLVFNDARQAFTDNKFKEAVSLFTRALTLNPNHVILLDCRAVCYEKLDQVKFALADAATMVNVAPKDARGYLRGGKLFANQKKFTKAIGLYKHALQKVDPKDARFQLILELKEKAEKATKPPQTMNIMDKLPYDVNAIIFSYLSFDRRVQCCAVSQNWRNFALQWSGMWRNLEFENHRPSQNIIKRYLSYAQGRHVRSFSIHNANRNTIQNILQSLVDENCQYLETLDLRGCDILITSLARMLRVIGKHIKHLCLDNSNITMTEILEVVIPMCPELTHLSILGLSPGREYSKQEYPLIDKLTFIRCNILGDKIIRLSHHLNTIDVYSNTMFFLHFYNGIVSTHKELETLHFSYGPTIEKTSWSPHTNNISKGKGVLNFGIYEERFFNSNVMKSFFIENPNLQQLTILGCGSDIGTGLANYVNTYGLPQLLQINLLNCPSLTETDLHDLITKCPLLQQVSLPRLMSVTDAIMNDLATSTTKLKMLDISDCSTVTGVGLQSLIRAHHAHLEKLILNNCPRIGPDAVNWATNQVGKSVIECKFRYK